MPHQIIRRRFISRRNCLLLLVTGDYASKVHQNAPKLGKLVKVFVSLRTSGKLYEVIDGLDFEYVISMNKF